MSKNNFNTVTIKIARFRASINLINLCTLLLFLFLLSLHSGCGRVYFPFKLESVSRSERDAAQTKPKIELLALTEVSASEANKSRYNSLVRIGGGDGSSSKLVNSSIAIKESFPPNVDPGEYKIGSNDILEFTLIDKNLTTRSFNLLVSGAGTINLLTYGNISASGLTIPQLKDKISERLVFVGAILNFEISIKRFNSKNFYVNYKKLPYISIPIYLKDILSSSDLQLKQAFSLGKERLENYNLADLAEVDRDAEIKIIRADKEYRVSALKLFRQKSNKIRILPEDQIIISPLKYYEENVLIIGETGAQVKVPVNSVARLSLSDVVFSGNTINSLSSDISQIYLLRETRPQEFIAYHLDITNPTRATLASKIEMRPRDIVYVAAQPLTLYNRVLGQILTSVNMTSSGITTLTTGTD